LAGSWTIGEVVASRDLGFAAGDIVIGFGNWQDYATLQGKTLRKLDAALASVTTRGAVLQPIWPLLNDFARVVVYARGASSIVKISSMGWSARQKRSSGFCKGAISAS
jgi:N-terminal domain of oxidoreductase